jgi:phosphoribosylamine--glycine ligase
MKLLVIGSGGREHAMAWRLAQNPGMHKVFVAPGNAGTARERRLKNVNLTDPLTLASFAEREGVHLTVVGPEAPLAAGVVDVFRARGLKIFGPTREAAQLESSKDFAKRFMARHHIPTAEFATFSESTAAHAYIDRKGAPIVIKADGLAAGKGVVVAMTLEEAHAAIDDMLSGNKLGDAGARVVIEEFLDGEEASFIVMVDGKNVLPLASSQDHKRIFDGDQGPNTGGMGAYSPAPCVTPEVHARAMREIILPTVKGMAADGIPFTGFLYAGLMIGKDGSVKDAGIQLPHGRPGNPADPDAPEVGFRRPARARRRRHARPGRGRMGPPYRARRRAGGRQLSGTPRKGDVIAGLPKGNSFGDDAHVFHAGTAERDGQVVTAGGRVLCVTALGENTRLAQKRAYKAASEIRWDGMQFRTDIGYRALGR